MFCQGCTLGSTLVLLYSCPCTAGPTLQRDRSVHHERYDNSFVTGPISLDENVVPQNNVEYGVLRFYAHFCSKWDYCSGQYPPGADGKPKARGVKEQWDLLNVFYG